MKPSEAKHKLNEQARGGDGHPENGANAAAVDSTTADAEMEQLRADLEAARDGMLRARADLDNYQKRAARERNEERRFAALPLIRDLLNVRDNLQRAVQAADSGGDGSALLEGVKLVVQQFTTVLEQHGCKEMPVAPGASFDPNQHEAVSKLPSPVHPEGVVTAVVRPGFQMHERIIRPAQVIVSSGPANQESGVRSQESGVRSQQDRICSLLHPLPLSPYPLSLTPYYAHLRLSLRFLRARVRVVSVDQGRPDQEVPRVRQVEGAALVRDRCRDHVQGIGLLQN